MGNTPNGQNRKTWVPAGGANRKSRIPPGSLRPEDLFSSEELKSARLVAMQGPFVDAETGQLLSEFYQKYAPEKDDEEHISNIIQSGMELKMLNQKLRDKYGFDLDDFVLQQGGQLK